MEAKNFQGFYYVRVAMKMPCLHEHLNKKEPKPEKGMPACPEWLLPEAKAEWKRLSEKLNQMGVLTKVDMEAFVAYCQSFICDVGEKYHILEIAVDRWNATHMIQNLEDAGLTMVPFG